MPNPLNYVTCRLALLAVGLAGCAAHGDVDLLESELRRHELVEEELTAQLDSAREEIRVARADSENLRAQLASKGQSALAAEQAESLYRATAIQFNTLLTGGLDRDGRPGDDGFSVLVLPVDPQGDLVKLAGGIEIELLDLSLRGDAQRIGQWRFTADQVRERWHKGFLSAGYLFQLDWQTPPSSSLLTLHARFLVPDGREFDATTQVRVTTATSQNVAQATSAPATPQRPVVQAKHTERKRRNAAPAKKTARPAPPQIRPGKASNEGPGHATLRTSDSFTAESLPTVR